MAGARLREGDGVEEVVPVMDHDTVLCFHPDGLCRSLKAHQVPEGSRTSAGTAIVQARQSLSCGLQTSGLNRAPHAKKKALTGTV